mmetsp:Transcript_18634/g.48580  ORF Transcript_18634/g.48580 Transcript_18634/m.48580 type:complete len:273 (+) Transcript_18634:255-1073(+)
MDAYTAVKKSGLKFKGEKKKKKKRDKKALAAAAAIAETMEMRHQAFWLVTALDQLVGNVLVETASGGYLTAVDDGTLTTALPRPVDHDPDNMPEPQDIFTLVKVSDTRMALKTAYGRYVTSVPDTGEVTARTEAMGVRELWEPMLGPDGVLHIRSADKKYFSAMRPGDVAHAAAESRDDPGVLFRVHSSASLDKAKPKKRGEYEITGGTLENMETSFAKKFQSYQSQCFKEGETVKVSKEERRRLKEAKKKGRLHEEMLNRRAKLKSDKFCK